MKQDADIVILLKGSRSMLNDEKYMLEAYLEAKKAYNKNEVPVGAVLVVNDKIIAKSHNLRNSKKNVLYHAEILAISKACKKLRTWVLDEATLYVTIEPCIMCAGTILQARIKRLVYGANQPRYGCIESLMHLYTDYKFNNTPEVSKGIMEKEIKDLMQSFFQKLRH